MFEGNLASPELQLANGFASHVAHWAKQQGASDSQIRLIETVARALSLANSDGHVCMDLHEFCSSDISLEHLRLELLACGVVGQPENPGAMPVILDQQRLYLHRYFDYQRRLARRLFLAHAQPCDLADTLAGLQASLQSLFAANAVRLGQAADWQKLAAAMALRNRLTIVSGGPGTGKTTMVVNLLACLLQHEPDNRVALAAPTGKAAARMSEAIRERAADLSADVRERLPKEAFTIHRLLGMGGANTAFKHHAGQPLAIDTLIVDEASMLDLALATHLLEAVPDSARIILLGDKDQLAAVESGAVFAELSRNPAMSEHGRQQLAELAATPIAVIDAPPARADSKLSDSVVWFRQNFRFVDTPAIGTLATLINSGEVQPLLDWLSRQTDPAVLWLADANPGISSASWHQMLAGFADYLTAIKQNPRDHVAVSKTFEHFRVLCAVREGERGTLALNAALSKHLRQQLEDDNDFHGGEWFVGRPVMVLRNDYVLKLFNGDIGITLPDQNGELMVFFPQANQQFQQVAPMRLPEHETAFAMTIHKSQGSEFDQVMVVLPNSDCRILTRELLYTGVTRAKTKVLLAASQSPIEQAVSRTSKRRFELPDC